MAAGYLRHLAGDRIEVLSAGSEPGERVNPMAVQAMAEEGIDISLQKSKTVDRFIDQRFDLVITVCDDAAEACPVFPNAAERRHWSFPDPSAVLGDAEQRFAAFASVRDSIRDRIERELLAVAA
jgi:arsenate reductase (thioredoxin)